MEEQNKLIPINQNNLVQKVNTTIAITNKLIAENNRQLVKEIFERNRRLFIDLISKYYPLNEDLLELYHDNKLHLYRLSENIYLTVELIERFKDKWDWWRLSKNESFTNYHRTSLGKPCFVTRNDNY